MKNIKNIEGKTLKHCRKQLGLTQKELGILMGFPEHNADVRIAQYESGKRRAKMKIIRKLSEILGICKYSILPVSVENETAVMQMLMRIDTLYGLEMKNEDGEIYMKFPNNCETINRYTKQLYCLKEMLETGQISYDKYLYIKAAFGETVK